VAIREKAYGSFANKIGKGKTKNSTVKNRDPKDGGESSGGDPYGENKGDGHPPEPLGRENGN